LTLFANELSATWVMFINFITINEGKKGGKQTRNASGALNLTFTFLKHCHGNLHI